MEIVPNTGVYCETSTIIQAKIQGSQGKALSYLMKRFYSQRRLIKSSISSDPEGDFLTLPGKEIKAIKSKLIN